MLGRVPGWITRNGTILFLFLLALLILGSWVFKYPDIKRARIVVTSVNPPADIEARTQMLVCSSMGATAFQKGLGAMHALAHPLGALYNAHHGMLNAILMPYLLQANRSEIEQRIERLTQYMGLEECGFTGFMTWVLKLREQLAIPHTLADIGIDDSRAETVGKMAVEDPSSGGNPISFSAREYQQIFINAVKGVL